jgi:hypothetical protein
VLDGLIDATGPGADVLANSAPLVARIAGAAIDPAPIGTGMGQEVIRRHIACMCAGGGAERGRPCEVRDGIHRLAAAGRCATARGIDRGYHCIPEGRIVPLAGHRCA